MAQIAIVDISKIIQESNKCVLEFFQLVERAKREVEEMVEN